MSLPTSTTVFGKVPPKPSLNISSHKIVRNYGFKYPLEENPGNGYFSKESGIPLIKSNLNQLIKTIKGERFMLPDYGCNLKYYLMEPIDDTLFEQIKNDIYTSIRKYLSKVNILKLQLFESKSSNVYVKLFCNLNDSDLINFESEIRI